MTNGHHDRKLAAILAADVVGYSRLMGADETGTLDTLQEHLAESVRPIVAQHGGRIFKTTGDGLLAEFTSAVQAVESAVAVQRACEARNRGVPAEKQLRFRIGINLGDVIAEGDDIFGDGVNIAARLEGVAEPGGISVSQAVYDQVVGKVGVGFSKIGLRNLKNIAVPIQVFRAELEPKDSDSAPPLIEDRPSIAVLPFETLSADESLNFIVNGLVEDVITLLARVPGFFVIAGPSSFAYSNQTPDIRQVGRELGVRYLVQGSIRASGPRVRVGVQLAEAETGRQLWSQRFDADRSEALDLQDKIAHSIMVELEPELTRAELTVIHRQRPENLDAWSRYRKAVGAIAFRGWNEKSVAEAIGELESSTELDPKFALALSYLAVLSAFAVNLSLMKDVPEVRRKALQAAERSIALDPESSAVLGRAGCAIADLGENARGCEILERAVENDPSNAQARVALGAAQCRLGKFDIGMENMRLGMRLSPRDASLGFWGMLLAEAMLKANRPEEALIEAQRSRRRDAGLYGTPIVAAIALTRLRRIDEARNALIEARRIRPAVNLAEIEKFFSQNAASDLKSIWNGGEAPARG